MAGPGPTLSIEVAGQETVLKAFEAIADVDVEETLDRAAAILLDKMRKRYLAQVAPDGTPWVPSLAARIRAMKGIDGGTGYDSGHLFNSLQLYNEGPGTRAIGTDVPYAFWFHFGAKGGPPRPIVGVAEEDVELVTMMIQKTIMDAIGEATK